MARKRVSKETTIEPRILGFVCNWGAYSGVEMAGVNRLEYPASIKLVRLMCLGRLHLGLLLKAFELGAAGVILLGCPAQDCSYEAGMEKAKELFTQAKQVLRLIGIDQRRLALLEVPLGGGDFVSRELSAFAKRISQTGTKAKREAGKVATPV